MSANQLELLFVAFVAIAFGYFLLFVRPERYPESLRTWPVFSGRWRKPVGWIALATGIANVAIAIANK